MNSPVTYNFVDDRPPPRPPEERIENREGLPEHLGGHENETHLDEGALNYAIETFGIKSMLDIGCGPAGMVELAHNKGLEVLGVDGDFNVKRPDSVKDKIVIHDYYTGPYIPPKQFDLGWSVEFVEHIDWFKMQNFLETFQHCKYIIMTHALPGQPGHHHVNCQVAEYWWGAMNAFGFELLVNESNEMRRKSTMSARYVRQQGYLFKNGRI